MKLTREEIKFIDNWLQFAGIAYIDVRYELVDHLVIEFEQQTETTNLETFVRDRLPWCKLAAKEKEKCMHKAMNKAVWKQAYKVLLTTKIMLPILLYFTAVLVLNDQLSARSTKLLLVAPFWATFLFLAYRANLKSFKKELREKVLAILKLGTLFTWPQLFLNVIMPSFFNDGTMNVGFFYFFVIWSIFATVVTLATINVHDQLYGRILKEYNTMNGFLA